MGTDPVERKDCGKCLSTSKGGTCGLAEREDRTFYRTKQEDELLSQLCACNNSNRNNSSQLSSAFYVPRSLLRDLDAPLFLFFWVDTRNSQLKHHLVDECLLQALFFLPRQREKLPSLCAHNTRISSRISHLVIMFP